MTRYIGLSLCERGLRAVAVRKRRRRTQVLGCAERSWPSSCLRPDFRELNAIEEESFVATVRNALQSLGVRRGRIALSLSDAVGKMLITTLDNPLKRGREGINLLKWQLREQLLLDPEEIRLAFQVIGTDPGGRTRVLVAAAGNAVLEQYENLLTAVGATPAIVLFDSLNLMHFYHSRGSLGDHLLITRASATLTLHLYREGRLQACRCRPAPADERTLFQEVSRTLAAWEGTWPEAATVPAYLHETTGVASCREALEGALGRVPQAPPTPLNVLAPGPEGGGQRFEPDYFAAVGGAERLIYPFGR